MTALLCTAAVRRYIARRRGGRVRLGMGNWSHTALRHLDAFPIGCNKHYAKRMMAEFSGIHAGAVAYVILALIMLIWWQKILCYLVLGTYALAILFLVPSVSRPINVEELRRLYSTKLLSYQECPDVWDGEGRRGMNCSGLTRKALEDAL